MPDALRALPGTRLSALMPEPRLTGRQVFAAWWPLAASWLLMGTEMTLVSATIARLADAPFHLAAFGGLVFPMALLVEAPIIMMLAASTALSTDREAFATLLRFCTALGLGLTLLHALLAFTPLYDLVLVTLIGPPEGAIEPGRLGLQWMLPWTWAIGDRRLHQGLLIRFDRSRAVVIGTLVRLAVMGAVLVAGLLHGAVPGVAVAGAALSAGVLAEMVSARVLARPVRAGPLARAAIGEELTLRRLLAFYLPLAVTPILNLVALPLGSASIARMPAPLTNLAAWPATNGLVFMSRSIGIAFNEVVVSLSGRPEARAVLDRFARGLATLMTLALTVVALTPLSGVWFGGVAGLEGDLSDVAQTALPLAVLLPGLTVMVSLYTGRLVYARTTRGIPESVALSLLATTAVLAAGAWLDRLPGVQVTLVAFSVGAAAQILWLRLRQSR